MSETYELQDCTFYDPLTSTPKNNWIIDTGMSISSDSTGTTISGSTTKYMKLQVDLTNFEMEWDYISGSGGTPIGIQTWKGSTWVCYGTYNNTESRYVLEGTSKVYRSTSLKSNATYKYTVNNGTHSWYVDDELIQSVSAKSGSGTFYIGVYVSANCTSQKLKNVKIKPL